MKNLGARDIYLGPLEKGDVQVSADYLSSLTEALNRKINGDDAAPVATPDVQSTVAQLKTFGEQEGITPLEPAEAEDANAYAVTKDYAEKNNLKTLSDLGKLGKPIALAANSDCSERPDCGKGLTSVYGIKLSKIEPLGFGSPDTKNALTKGEVQLGQVGTTDGSLEQAGIVVLEDDKNWQNAENLVPVVNSAWLKKNPKAADGPQQALRRAHHRGPEDAQRQGRRRAARGQPGRRGLPQGEGPDLGPMAERVFLHIGAAKTGTSYLQQMIWGNRGARASKQIFLPLRRRRRTSTRWRDLRGGIWARRVIARTWDELAAGSRPVPGRGGQRGAAVRHPAGADRAGARVAGPVPVHVIHAARDIGRQVPAEWQQSLRARSPMAYDE